MARVLVTGCGRSGTRFVATALKHAGVNAGHEHLFTTTMHEWPANYYSGVEISWLAVPWLHELPSDVSIVHLVRHPLDVVRSFLGIRFFEKQWSEYTRFVMNYCPGDVLDGKPIDQALGYWLGWNSMVSVSNHIRIRVECLTPAILCSLFGTLGFRLSRRKLEESFEKLGTRHNGRERALTTSAEILKRPLGKKVRSLAVEYGYKL